MTKLHHSFCALIVLLTGFVHIVSCTSPYHSAETLVNNNPSVHTDKLSINAGSPENINR